MGFREKVGLEKIFSHSSLLLVHFFYPNALCFDFRSFTPFDLSIQNFFLFVIKTKEGDSIIFAKTRLFVSYRLNGF